MRVYLIKDLPGKGKAGEIISANDGYAKNFIIKNGIGKVVDNAVLNEVKAKKASDAYRTEQEIAAIRARVTQLGAQTFVLHVSIGANGKMFGSVTAAEIAAAAGLEKRNIHLAEPIRATGSYKVKVKFPHGIDTHIDIIVEAKK